MPDFSDPLSANELRWLAEAADGKRDRSCAIVIGDNGRPIVVEENQAGARDRLGVNTYTPFEGDGMRVAAKVRLIFADGSTADLPDDTDAVFLTQTAVGKFVLPYYLRMQTPDWVDRKKAELFKANVVAAVHAEPSITSAYPKSTTYPLRPNAHGVIEVDLNAL